MSEADFQRRVFAHHEAAHAFVARLAGQHCYAVSLDAETGERFGATIYMGRGDGETHADILRADLVCLAAGAFGGLLADPRGQPGDQSDRDTMCTVARRIVGCVATWNEVQGEMERATEAARLITFHHREEIGRIAEALIAHHALLEKVQPLGWPYTGLFRPDITQEVLEHEEQES